MESSIFTPKANCKPECRRATQSSAEDAFVMPKRCCCNPRDFQSSDHQVRRVGLHHRLSHCHLQRSARLAVCRESRQTRSALTERDVSTFPNHQTAQDQPSKGKSKVVEICAYVLKEVEQSNIAILGVVL
eukprot:5889681-Amphidinium_carterae.1